MVYCIAALRLFFQSRPQIYVSGNLFIYYEEGKPSQNISPDVFVIVGVNNRERRSYKAWQEGGKLPSFILELTSKSTKKQDEEIKPELYRQLGVQEYFQYDPTGDYLHPQLKGQQLVTGQYQPLPAQTLPNGTVSISSQVLGLDLRLLPPTITSFIPISVGPLMRELRFFDPATETHLPTYAELERSRVQSAQIAGETQHRMEQAEQAAAEERQRAKQAEQAAAEERQRAERLAEQLRSLGIDPETLP